MTDIKLICSLNKNWRPGSIKIQKAGGQTNRNWIVQYVQKKFFVRFPWQETGIVDRKAEARNILALSRCKKLARFLPKCYFYIFNKKNIIKPKSGRVFNFPDGTMVSQYIEGKDIDGQDLEKPKIQEALLKTLYCFHTSGVKFVNNYDVFQNEVEKYKKKAKKHRICRLVEEGEINKIEAIEKEMRKGLSSGGAISTHNDLIFENLRLGKNGRVYLLDFEYAGFNVRDGLYYDLGIILGGNLFQKNPLKIKTFEEILQKAQKIYKKELPRNKIYAGALVNILVMFWWGIVRYFSVKSREEKEYFKDYVLKRAKGIKFLYNIVKNISIMWN